MAPRLFAHTILLDSQVYHAERRTEPPATHYAPKVASQLVGPGGMVSLDPVNITTFHKGAGASRRTLDGMFSHTQDGWTCDPGILMPGPARTVVTLPNAPASIPNRAFWEQDGDLYFAAGHFAFRIPTGSGAPVLSQDFSSGAVVNVRRISGSVIVSMGYGGGAVWERPDGGAWTQAQTGTNPVKVSQLGSVFWTTGGVTAERVVGQWSATGLRYTNGGAVRTSGSWTPSPDTPVAAIDVGPYSISSLVTTRDHLYVLSTGGIRDLDSSGLAPLLTPETEFMLMDTNGQAGLAAGGWVYGNYGYGLLRVYVANSFTYAQTQWVTPMVGLPNETPVSGYGTAIMRRGQWIIYALFDPTAFATWVCWGREATSDEPGPMTWHVAPIYLPALKVQAMWISGLVVGNPRLWMLTSDAIGTVSLRWAPLALATPYQDIRQGRAYQCHSSFKLWTMREDWGDDSVPKDLEELASEGENIGTGTSMSLKVAVNGQQVFSQLGQVTTSPRQVLSTPTAVQGNVLQFEIDGAGQPTTPPILRKLSARATPQADLREMKNYRLRLGRAVHHSGGSRDDVDPRVRQAHLESLQASGARVTLVDEDGLASVVKVRSNSLTVFETDEQGGERVLAAEVQLIQLVAPVGPALSITLDGVGQGQLDTAGWRLD